MGVTVGIDLGTTNSAIAYIGPHGRPEIIKVDQGKSILPSVICFKEGEILIGEEAKEYQELGIYPIAAFFKRQMGSSFFFLEVDGKHYSALDLSAMILKKLKQDAEKELGETITDAVITVPAYFKAPERNATIKAGEMAGLNILQIINEPTAAAVAYGMKGNIDPCTLLVYDLGGGTFDVALLSLDADGIEVISSVGDHNLGGKDWDERIIEFLASSFKEEYGTDPFEDAESLADLYVQAEKTKKKLSDTQSVAVSINHQGERARYSIDRDTFNRLTRDLMECTVSMTTSILEDMGKSPADLKGILLVGGSTRMPMVTDFVTCLSGKAPIRGINVDEAVALGAAAVAHNRIVESGGEKNELFLGGITKIRDVTNHGLGMIAINADKSAYVNSVILPKNKSIPCEMQRPFKHFSTKSKSDNTVEIFMTQGDSEQPGDVTYLGRYVVHQVPAEKDGTVIDITYRYDINETVDVSAKTQSGGIDLPVTVEELPTDIPDRFLQAPSLQPEMEHITAYLAFDMSGSMSGQPICDAKKAAKGFLENLDLASSSLGVIAFSNDVRVKLEASQNAAKIENAIEGLESCETGVGNSGHPFDEGLSLLKDVEGRRFLIVLADGMWSYQDKAINQAKKCHKESIEVIAIGFGGADEAFLKDIASMEEAGIFTSQDHLTETFSTIAQVITETGGNLRAQGGRLSLLKK